jgi:hypothetical protein
MGGYQDDKGFRDRLTAAAQAKKAALDKFRARPAADDPAVIEQQAARQALSEARDVRTVARKAAREEEAAQRAATAEREAAEKVTRDADEKATREAREASLKAEQKAARDARYAARKKKR